MQEYDYHLAAVNTITFVDEGRRFVSTSDDKTIRVWEVGIPVQVGNRLVTSKSLSWTLSKQARNFDESPGS